jgi:hypothetical protein
MTTREGLDEACAGVAASHHGRDMDKTGPGRGPWSTCGYYELADTHGPLTANASHERASHTRKQTKRDSGNRQKPHVQI